MRIKDLWLKRNKAAQLTVVLLAVPAFSLCGQAPVESIPYGSMDSWIRREIRESALIGKKEKVLYAPGKSDTIRGEMTYQPGDSPWSTSNMVAKVSGITKVSTSVYPEKRGNGYCARMETQIESCSALGIVHIDVLVGGSVYLGRSIEPVRNTSNPRSKIASGIPFTKRPKALVFDYKVQLSGESKRIRLDGFSRQQWVEGKDKPLVCLYLQRRWEGEDGMLYAKRIGTRVITFEESCDWVDQSAFPIWYGDITQRPDYQPWMGLVDGDETRYAFNSHGENVPVKEIGWGSSGDEPTHLILEFLSSHGGSYIGSPGNQFWIDNVGFIYE